MPEKPINKLKNTRANKTLSAFSGENKKIIRKKEVNAKIIVKIIPITKIFKLIYTFYPKTPILSNNKTAEKQFYLAGGRGRR